MNRSMMLLTAAVAVVALSQASFAQGEAHYPVVQGNALVSYGDLNLANARDAHQMLDRIDHAAKRACGWMPERAPEHRVAPGFTDQAFRKCRDGAVRKAVADLGSPLVARAYAEAQQVPLTRIAKP